MFSRFIQKHKKNLKVHSSLIFLNIFFVIFHVAELMFNYCRYEAIVGIANMLLNRLHTIRNSTVGLKNNQFTVLTIHKLFPYVVFFLGGGQLFYR